MNIVELLVLLQIKGFYRISHFFLVFLGLEIPKAVTFKGLPGKSVKFVHRSPGTVFHPRTTIGNNVHIYQNVTIGKARLWDDSQENGCCYIHDNAILCSGAKILFKNELLSVGEGTVIGANAVLTQSTGEYEIWAGIPAKKIGVRPKSVQS